MIIILVVGFFGFLAAASLEFLFGEQFIVSLFLAWVSLSLALVIDLRRN